MLVSIIGCLLAMSWPRLPGGWIMEMLRLLGGGFLFFWGAYHVLKFLERKQEMPSEPETGTERETQRDDRSNP
jgi:hypothetical protein